MWEHGRYQGWIWTLDSALFDRSDVRHWASFYYFISTDRRMLLKLWKMQCTAMPQECTSLGLQACFRQKVFLDELSCDMQCRHLQIGRPRCLEHACGGPSLRGAPLSLHGTSHCQRRPARTGASPPRHMLRWLRSWLMLSSSERLTSLAPGVAS